MFGKVSTSKTLTFLGEKGGCQLPGKSKLILAVAECALW